MQPYGNYSTIYNPQETAIQRQIGYLQQQLQQIQQQQPLMQQPQMVSVPTQAVQQQNGIMAQIVENFDNISANSVPMDNNGAIFIKNDGSEIQSRRWTAQGTIQTTSYLPNMDVLSSQINNSTLATQTSEVKLSDDVTEAFMKRFDDISTRLERIEQSWGLSENNKEIEK